MSDLGLAGRKFESNVFIAAGYDGPYAFVRHNEVWVMAEL